MAKILLYYKYVDIDNPLQIVKWQRALCESLNLKGRILIAHEGINGTLGGSIESLEQYKKVMDNHILFSDIDFKESIGNADDFPRLQVTLKKEIVGLKLDTKKIHAKNGGKHLTPSQAHALIAEKPDDLVLLDARNNYESRIGTFVDAITPDINNFRDFPQYIDQNLDLFANKKVLMFCTGGIRCERASAYLKSKNVAGEILQIKGGIHRYVEEFPDGYFKGKNYVFDGRLAMKVSDDILAQCEHCKTQFDEYTNCVNAECNKQIIVCPACISSYHNTCSSRCLKLVQNFAVNIRTTPRKTVEKNK